MDKSLNCTWREPDYRGTPMVGTPGDAGANPPVAASDDYVAASDDYAPSSDGNGNRLIQVAVADQDTYAGFWWGYVPDNDFDKASSVASLWKALGKPA